MPELPWEKWYPTNWASEPGLRLCEAATRGIWFEAVNTMMLMESDHVSGTVEQLASLCICRVPQMQLAIEQLKTFNVCEVTMQNECITLANRKRKRDCKIKEMRRNAANSRWCKTDAKPYKGEDAPSASASASKSVFVKPSIEEVRLFVAKVGLPESDADWFWNKCEGNGWKNGGVPIKNWQRTITSWKIAGYMASQKNNLTSNGSTAVNPRISQERELERVVKELGTRSPNLNDYPRGSKAYNRIVELRLRRDELKKLLGVVA